jgi:hypothetical protein
VSLNIPAIADKLNELARSHSIGKLQALRKELKGLNTQPGTKIFNTQTIFKNWAFHYGGRTELQFNIGHENDTDGILRHGVAFSFELSRTLPSIGVLLDRVKFFNDFVKLNAGEFSDMRMWHYDPDRSVDHPPGPIPPELVKKDAFVFLGNRQPLNRIDYEKILDDFDRLLPLYLYVESHGTTAPVALPKTGFEFKAGHSKKTMNSRVTLLEKELELDFRHNLLQDALYKTLVSKYGVHKVSTEQLSGVGTRIDVVVKMREEFWFYEIKTALTARACLREAIGQLLEYGFWPGAQEPARLVVVGECPIDADGKEYLLRLRKQFSLSIEYEVIQV